MDMQARCGLLSFSAQRQLRKGISLFLRVKKVTFAIAAL